MLKHATKLALILGPLTLFGANQQLPQFIDFGSQEFATNFYDRQYFPEFVTSCPFNCASEMSTFFTYIEEEYNIRTVIETGTFKANTTVFFASTFDTVHTVEVNPEFYAESKQTLQQFPNVQCHLGSSPIILRKILPSLANERVLFYLDAHWYTDWPLLDELREIRRTHKNNCIIVIDDFKVPGRNDIPYDTHMGNDYSFEYVQKHLHRIFNEYTVHYLIPKDVNARAKFVAIPKSWASR